MYTNEYIRVMLISEPSLIMSLFKNFKRASRVLNAYVTRGTTKIVLTTYDNNGN
jgi:hypothetical protein